MLAAPARAEICQYVDKDGRSVFSDAEVKGAKKVKCFAPLPPPPAKSAPPSRRNQDSGSEGSAEGRSAGSRARVEGEVQKKRDEQRRQILERELADEQQRLEEAKAALAEQESVRHGDERNYQRFLDRVQPYRDAVASHEKNVAAIKKELAALR